MANEFIARKGLIVSGSARITGSLDVSAGITGSLFGTSSWAQNATTASAATSITFTPSTASFATTAATASLLLGSVVSASYAATASVGLVAKAVDIVEGSIGTNLTQYTGSFTGSLTGTLIGTGSWAANATSASFTTTASAATSITFTPSTASYATTSSFAAQANAVDYTNVTNKPTLVSASGQVSYTGLSNIPTGIVSSSGQVSYTGLSNIPTGILSSSTQINNLTDVSASFATTAITSSYPINITGSSQFPTIYTVGTSDISLTGSSYFGYKAGNGTSNANFSIFVGHSAGEQASNAGSSVFVGYGAGAQTFFGQTTDASESVFVGRSAGEASNAAFSNFIGRSAGTRASDAISSNFIGYYAGYRAASARNSNFLGYYAGYNATKASSSILIGFQAGYSPGSTANSIGANNVIIGTNISLPANTANAINIGAIIYATGSYSDTTSGPSSASVAGGRVGIGTFNPVNTLQVEGNVSASSYTSSISNDIGFFGTASWAQNATFASAATSITFTPATASFATTASAATSITFTPSTASYAITASYALAGGSGGGGSGTVTSVDIGNGLTGTNDPITTSGDISLDTGSVHFISGSIQVLNTKGVVSSSSQVSYTGVSNIPSGILSSSTQINALSGVSASYAATASSFSGSLQVVGLAEFYEGLVVSGGLYVSASDTTATNKFLVLNTTTNQVFTTSSIGAVTSASYALTASFASNAGSGLSGGTANYIPLWTSATAQSSSNLYQSTGNIGIGTTSPNKLLSVNGNANITGSLDVTGAFTAQTKSFKILHQRLPGKSLVYGVLEGPEHAVYARGRLKGSTIITLPEEWEWLVDMDSVTVNLTPIGMHQKLYVDGVYGTRIVVGNDSILHRDIDCYYTVIATRKDVQLLKTVE